MKNDVRMGKAFPMWGFSIPTPLNLLGNEMGNMDGKIQVRVWVWVCPFQFRTHMTICYSESGNKPEFLNSGYGPGSTRKI